jgi:hypothetical protein
MNEIIDMNEQESIKKLLNQKYLEFHYAINSNPPSHVQLEEFRNLIQKYPAFLWEDTANLTNRIIKDYLEDSGHDMTFRTLLSESIKNIKTELNYATSTIIEKMVIDSIAVSWVQLHHMEAIFTKSLYNKQSFDQKEEKFWDQLLTSAQKRYHRAIDSLVKLRKPGVNLQINIATNAGMQKIKQNIK